MPATRDAEAPGATQTAAGKAPGGKVDRRIKANFPLRFLHEVLGLDHLHYGLWQGEALDLAGLKSAQARYADYLIERIPDGVSSILDVGAGSGALSLLLKQRGFEVEGLSPDPYQAQLYGERVQRPFHLVRFQEFAPERPYDLVLMSESCQYIWLPSLFEAVKRATPEGYLLVADYFVVDGDDSAMAKSGHPLERFVAAAAAAGVELELREDITDRVLPTLDLGRLWLERHLYPSLDLLAQYLGYKYPRLFPFARRLFGRRIADKVAEIGRFADSREFRRMKRYMIFRFRVGNPH